MFTQTLHPMIVHFPIALLITGFLFATCELFFVRCRRTQCMLKTAVWLISLGALGALAAVCSGVLFTTMHTSVFFPMHRTLAFATAGVGVVAAALYCLYLYKTQTRTLHWAAWIVAAAAVGLVAATGHWGGLMVY